MTKPHKLPDPPPGLGETGNAFWTRILSEFAVEDHQLDLLAAACVQLDRAASAAAVVAIEGVTQKDRFGQSKVHPAVEVERQAQLAFCRLQRELGLDIAPPDSRGPLRPGVKK